MNKITRAYREGVKEFDKELKPFLATFARKLIAAARESMPEKSPTMAGGYVEAVLKAKVDEIGPFDGGFDYGYDIATTHALVPLDEFLEEIK